MGAEVQEQETEDTLGDFLAGLDDDVEGLMKAVGLETEEEVGDDDEGDASYSLDDAEEGDDDEKDKDDKTMAKAKARSKKKKKKNKDEEDEDEEEVEAAPEDEDEEFGKSIPVEGPDPLLVAALNEIDDLRQANRRTNSILTKSAKVQAGMHTLLKGIAARFANDLSEPEEPEAEVSIFAKGSRAGADGGEQKGPGYNEVLAKSLAAIGKGLLTPVEAVSMQNASRTGTMDEAQLATFERLSIALGSGQPS